MKSRLPTSHLNAGRLARSASLLLALAAVCLIGWAAPVRAQGAAMCPPGQDCPCAWSGWVNRDSPTATGDWEDLTSLVKVVGASLKDIGKKQSMVVALSNSLAREIEPAFRRCWSNATKFQ